MEVLNVSEVADVLRISETTVYRLIQFGHLKAVHLGARRRVVSREVLDEFIRGGGIAEDPDLFQ